MGALVSNLKNALGWSSDLPCVLILGAEFVGKTTLLYKFVDAQNLNAPGPTNGLNFEDWGPHPAGGVIVRQLEMSGSRAVRPLWNQYLPHASALIWVVDAQNRNTLHENKDLLSSALALLKSDSIPLIVALNKSDHEYVIQIEEVTDALALRTIETRRWEVIACDAVSGAGIQDLRDAVARLFAPNA